MQGRSLEIETLKELFDQNQSGNIPVLVEIKHPEIKWKDNSQEQENGYLRLINAPMAVMFNGHKYLPSVFQFSIPKEDGSKVGDTSITISSIDQRIIEVIRAIKTNPIATIEAFYSKISDDEYMFSKLYHFEFKMGSCSWDDVTAKWTLEYDPAMQINVPKDKATTFRCPAVNERG